MEDQISALKSEDGINDADNKKQIEMLQADFNKLKQNPTANENTTITSTSTPGEGEKLPADWNNIGALSDDDKEALIGLGVKPVQIEGANGKVWALSLPTKLTVENLKALKAISDAKNVPVAVAHNPDAREDKWIAGKIDNIKSEDGKLLYTVDCENVGKFGYKYDVKQTEKNKNEYRISLLEGVKLKEGHVANPQTYTYSGGLLSRTGAPVISTNGR